MTSNITVRVDSQLKSEVKEVLDLLGMDMTTAVRIYLQQIVIQKKIPFEITLESQVEAKQE